MTQFLLRLDDACPTMRLPAWRAIEELVDSLAIRPVVGVIPDNRDHSVEDFSTLDKLLSTHRSRDGACRLHIVAVT